MLQAKTQHFHDGSDKLLRHVLLWTALLPLRERRAAAYAGVPAAGLLLQLLCMYWQTVARRTGPTWWC